MNEERIVERLAEFMGFKKRTEFMGEIYYWFNEDIKGDLWIKIEDWNPLKDWNHWRQVEEKVMDSTKRTPTGESIWIAYEEKLLGKDLDDREPIEIADEMMIADLPTRCKALVFVLS